MMKNDEIALVVNTVEEKRSAIQDSYEIRREALTDQIPTYTTLAGARAAAIGMSRDARARSVRDPGAARAPALSGSRDAVASAVPLVQVP